MNKKLIIASNNAHKVNEIKKILNELGITALSLKESGILVDVEETGSTFLENARLKAHGIYDLNKDYMVLSDDSGLQVNALNGAPGIYSARFAGEHGNDKKNKEKLLEELKDVPKEKRDARFVCAMVLIVDENKTIEVEGHIDGYIGFEEKGKNGFGYDPLFIVPSLNKSFAELSEGEKNSISHRANALSKLKEELKKIIR